MNKIVKAHPIMITVIIVANLYLFKNKKDCKAILFKFKFICLIK